MHVTYHCSAISSHALRAPDGWVGQREAPDDWSETKKARHKPRPRLRIVGPNSIAETLFTTPNVTGVAIEQHLRLLNTRIYYTTLPGMHQV